MLSSYFQCFIRFWDRHRWALFFQLLLLSLGNSAMLLLAVAADNSWWLSTGLLLVIVLSWSFYFFIHFYFKETIRKKELNIRMLYGSGRGMMFLRFYIELLVIQLISSALPIVIFDSLRPLFGNNTTGIIMVTQLGSFGLIYVLVTAIVPLIGGISLLFTTRKISKLEQ